MRRHIIRASGTVIAIVGWFALSTASAQPADKRTYFTFNVPVEVPGVALPAGKYLFRVANPDSSGNIVQVLNAEGNKALAMFFTLPAERVTPPPMPEVRFMEAPAGAPPPVKTWWHQGETLGREFVYPKEQAQRLAKNAANPVLTTVQQTTKVEQTNTNDLTRVASNGQESAVAGGGATPPAAPTGTAQSGEAAPASLKITVAAVPEP
jgi:hypothetical protein